MNLLSKDPFPPQLNYFNTHSKKILGLVNVYCVGSMIVRTIMFLRQALERAMNLHWGKTLEHKWVKVKNRPQNYTIYNHYNYTEYKLTAQKYYWNDVIISTNRTGNQSALYAENQFLKKSRIMTDLTNPSVRTQSFTTVVVISSIFLFLTMTITAAVVVFCRKRNTVFAFQKSEQTDEADYEMDDMNTDIEYTETEFESETDSVKPRKSLSHTGVCIESDYENSPVRRPLVTNIQQESEIEDSPVRQHVCRCGADPRGQYQRMVVTAVLEKPNRSSHIIVSDEESGTDPRSRYMQKINPHYYYPGYGGISSDIESDPEAMQKPPVINVTYADAPPAYDSLDYYTSQQKHSHTIQADVEKYYHHQFPGPPEVTLGRVDVHYENLPCQDMQVQTDKSFPEAAVVYVDLPPMKEKKFPFEEPSVEIVDLPPKPGCYSTPQASVPSTPTTPPNTSPLATPTTPLAPPTTPTGGVMGVALSMMGVVSMGQIDEALDSPPSYCPMKRFDPEKCQNEQSSPVSSPTKDLTTDSEINQDDISYD